MKSLIAKHLLTLSNEEFNSMYEYAKNLRDDSRDNPLDSDGDKRFSDEENQLIRAEFLTLYYAKEERESRDRNPDTYDLFI